MGSFEDGWTVVQRGGRRQWTRPPQWDHRGDRSNGWMASASPVSFQRGRDHFSYPNRPVPPPRTSRYYGPQSRSFASVVRQGDWRSARRPVSPRAEGSEPVMRQPADPQFGRLVRKMHALIKMVHHLQNVAPKPGKQQPKMISKMVEVLSTMIKPASPTGSTLEMIKGNADNWGYTTLLILQEHYEARLEAQLEEISGLLVPDWKLPFQVAIRWAKRNLPHVTQDVIDHTEALITARRDGNPQPQTGTIGQAYRPQQTTVTVATMTEGTSERAGQVSQSAQVEPFRDRDLQPPQIKPPREKRQGRLRGQGGVALTEDLLLDIGDGGVEDSPNARVQGDPAENSVHPDLEDLLGIVSQRDQGEPAIPAPLTASPVSKQGTGGAGQQVVQAQVHHEADDQGEASQDLLDQTSTPKRKKIMSTPVSRHCKSAGHVNSTERWRKKHPKKWWPIQFQF